MTEVVWAVPLSGGGTTAIAGWRNLSPESHLQPTDFRPAPNMLSTLPVEILLKIIQQLPFRTVVSLSVLSKSWAAFMETNESSIYHSISKRCGYAPDGNLDATPPPEGWRAWCEWSLTYSRSRLNADSSVTHELQIDLRWIGKLPVNPHVITIPGGRGKIQGIDEEAGYVISICTDGGLIVSDINDRRILWALEGVL